MAESAKAPTPWPRLALHEVLLVWMLLAYPSHRTETRMPKPHQQRISPDLRSISAAASAVAELLQALKETGWELAADPRNNGWRVQRSGGHDRTYAIVNDAYGYWQIAEVNTVMLSMGLTAAEQLRALADQLEAAAS